MRIARYDLKHWALILMFTIGCFFSCPEPMAQLACAQPLTKEQKKLIKSIEQQRISAINQVMGSVIAIFDQDKQGGGSGVIIDPSGIALTNHHVIIGSGVKGLGGLADGKTYKWKLIGTDPGGDVSVIQMEGRDDFPYSPLGDSDDVKVGDWALAMGNPFILTEDMKPTVTLGIVSGVNRYQYGAGKNQLVYGNCIQVDSSINPGNSGGPLFNLNGEIIGINGRGSFQDRGRVNVGLGYAISANQIKHFLPELLATKLVEHGTLDASFSERQGKVVCSTINELAPIYEMGLRLGDELLEFEGIPIQNSNQFTNLICTLPEDWPATLKVKTTKGETTTFRSRLIGLPYAKPKKPGRRPGNGGSDEERRQQQRAQDMLELLAAEPGSIRYPDINQQYASHILKTWGVTRTPQRAENKVLHVTEEIREPDGTPKGSQEFWIWTDGKFKVIQTLNEKATTYEFNLKTYSRIDGENRVPLSIFDAKSTSPIVEGLALAGAQSQSPFSSFGQPILDGADKTQTRVAFRFKSFDEDRDVFYFWYSMYRPDGSRGSELLKTSLDKDCDGEEGGILFGSWKDLEGWKLPSTKTHVMGLAEEATSKIEVQSAELIPAPEWGFDLTANKGETP